MSVANAERPPVDSGRLDPAGDLRRVVLFAVGVILVYAAAVAAFWPSGDDDPNQAIFVFLMFAPTAGALLARFFGPGVIEWGRPSWWILAGLIPTAAALVAYLAGAAVGFDTEDPGVLVDALKLAPLSITAAAVSALGEEIGWRGFLWPLVRSRFDFLRAAALIGVVWWLYHVPLILFGWYGSVAGLPAFTVAIAGFTLFVGVLTERSRSIWPSVMAHGAWNALVATSFAATEGDDKVPAFAGSDALLGEFGWLAATSTLIVGVAATAWHLRTQTPSYDRALSEPSL